MDQIICYKKNSSRSDLTDLVVNLINEEDILVELSNSLWRSPGGSLYKYTQGGFLCISVHSLSYKGWVNKVAIKNIHQVDTEWYGDQAFRNGLTGRLLCWETIKLVIMKNKIIKLFPKHIPNGTLLYGYTEEYTRVYDH